MVEVKDGEEPVVRTPIAFSDRVSEAQLEAWLIANPELCGESILVLGSQLAEFAEDKDRLDVLAVDQTGELLLIELKANEVFRVTDLQALAYASAYASTPTDHFAKILQKTLSRGSGVEATLEAAKDRITAFLKVQDFDGWEPSKRVRIKLIAPGFPQRVLKSVKWLGDVYGMPIEALEVKLFEDSSGALQLVVERLLPVAGDDEFDMTIRDGEVRRQARNITRREPVLTALLANGDLRDRQRLYYCESSLTEEVRDRFDPESPLFQVVLDASGDSPRFEWQASEQDPVETLSASSVWHSIHEALSPGRFEFRYMPVHNSFSTEPNGETLGELAERTGAW